MWPIQAVPLGKVIEQRKEFVTISDERRYKRCRVQLHAAGIVQRDEVDGSVINTKSQQVCRAGEFLVAEIDAKVGGFGIVPPDLDGAIVSSHYFLYSIDHSLLDQTFLDYYIKTHQFRDQVTAKGTTNYAAIRPRHVLEYTIPLPAIREQRRIVAKLEFLASRIQEAKQLRQSIQADMDSLLVAMAHRNDLSVDEKRAQGWKRTDLGDVLTQVVDPVKVEPGQEYPHFGIYSFAKGLFSKPPLIGGEIKASNLYRVRQGQFLYSKLKAFEGAFGVVPTEYDGFHVSNEFPTFDLDRKKIDVSFLLAYTKSPQVWKSFAVHSKGVGARRERLKPENLLAETLWLPPLEWQKKIKQTGNSLASIRQTYADTQPELDALLPSILDRAFKGNL